MIKRRLRVLGFKLLVGVMGLATIENGYASSFEIYDNETKAYLPSQATFKAVLTKCAYNQETHLNIKDHGDYEVTRTVSEYIDAEKALFSDGRGSIIPERVALDPCKSALLKIAENAIITEKIEDSPMVALFNADKMVIELAGTVQEKDEQNEKGDVYTLVLYLRKFIEHTPEISSESSPLHSVSDLDPMPESSKKSKRGTKKTRLSGLLKNLMHHDKHGPESPSDINKS